MLFIFLKKVAQSRGLELVIGLEAEYLSVKKVNYPELSLHNPDSSTTFASMSLEEIKRIASKEVQDYISSHAQEDETKLLLKHKSILGLPASSIVQQIAARRKAEAKLPTFYQTKGVVYPPSINLEQCSSEATAKFKSEIVRKETQKEKFNVVDLTGGFGIDSFFFSDLASVVDYIDSNAELNQLAQHNFEILRKQNVRFHDLKAEDFLTQSSTHYDFIFLDPSRRDSKAKKVFALSDCTPDVSQLLPRMLEVTEFVLLKASPLLDIKQALRELTNVKKVVVISVDNECKELLFQIEKNFTKEPLIETFNLDKEGKVKQAFEFYTSEEENASSVFAQPDKYLYEPNASILKAGAFKQIGIRLGLKKLHVNTHLYTSDRMNEEFPGRIFEVEQLGVDAKSLDGNYANIITRNYPLSAAELKKKLRTKDGGEKYVIAFSGLNKKYLAVAKRLA